MAIDYKWMSQGGLLLDGSGDIALTGSSLETIIAMTRTRLKAAIDGWQAYPGMGAGLEAFRGSTSDAATETNIQRAVLSAISTGFLPASMFTVNTLRIYGQIQVYVFINQQLIATASVATNTGG